MSTEGPGWGKSMGNTSTHIWTWPYTQTQTHTHIYYVLVLKRFRKDTCVSHMIALWHSCYEWGKLQCREESTWRLMCEASHWASVKKQNKAATQRNDSELSTDYELHFLKRCWSLTDVSIKYRYQTQVLGYLIHKQFYQITFVNYAFILKKGGCWMTECLLLFGSRIHEPGKKLCLISAVSRYVTFIKCTLLDNIQSTWSMPGRALLNSVLVSMCSGTSLHPTAGISAQRCRIFRDRCS